jgi:hypothetical protein
VASAKAHAPPQAGCTLHHPPAPPTPRPAQVFQAARSSVPDVHLPPPGRQGGLPPACPLPPCVAFDSLKSLPTSWAPLGLHALEGPGPGLGGPGLEGPGLEGPGLEGPQAGALEGPRPAGAGPPAGEGCPCAPAAPPVELDQGVIERIAAHLREAFGLRLFGFDVVVAATPQPAAAVGAAAAAAGGAGPAADGCGGGGQGPDGALGRGQPPPGGQGQRPARQELLVIDGG